MSAKSVDMDLALAYAERLREAGVLRFRSGTLEFTLSELNPSAEEAEHAAEEEEDAPLPNAMNDPASFGSRDGFVPGFAKLHEKKDDDD